MSRSRKKSPFIDFAVNNRGNKKNKQASNQKMRSRDNRRLKELALNYDEAEDYEGFMTDSREAVDNYTFNGDGKRYMDREEREMDNGKYMRK
jgi:hypothetical protein